MPNEERYFTRREFNAALAKLEGRITNCSVGTGIGNVLHGVGVLRRYGFHGNAPTSAARRGATPLVSSGSLRSSPLAVCFYCDHPAVSIRQRATSPASSAYSRNCPVPPTNW